MDLKKRYVCTNRSEVTLGTIKMWYLIYRIGLEPKEACLTSGGGLNFDLNYV